LFPSASFNHVNIEAGALLNVLRLKSGHFNACFTLDLSSVPLVTSRLISIRIFFHLFSNEVLWKFCTEFVGNKPHIEFDVDELYQIELKSIPNHIFRQMIAFISCSFFKKN